MSRNRRIARWKIAALATMAGALVAWLLTSMPITLDTADPPSQKPIPGFKIEETPDDLVMYVIYEKPKDFPTGFVVRKFVQKRGMQGFPAGILGTADTLEKARKFLPPGLTNMHRDPRDEPQIVETWM